MNDEQYGRQSRAKKENTSRNAALERLKKARQGEKIKYELVEDDDLYDEVEVSDEDEFIEDDIVDQKNKSRKKDAKKTKNNDAYHLDTVPVQTKSNKNITKEKLTASNTASADSDALTNKDIRSVFANAKTKKLHVCLHISTV
jgi:hypothetical protein